MKYELISVIATSIAVFAEIAFCVMIDAAILEPAKRLKKQNVLIILLSAITFVAVTNLFDINAFVHFAAVLALLYICVLQFSGSTFQRIMTMLIAFIFESAIEGIVAFLYSSLSMQEFEDTITLSVNASILNASVLLSAGYIFFRIRKTRYITIKTPAAWWGILLLYPIASIAVLFSFFYMMHLGKLHPGVISMDFGLILFALAGHLIILNRISNDSILRQQQLDLKLKADREKEKAALLLETYTNQRKLIHEFKNHLSLLYDLADSGETDKIMQHIQEVEPDLDGNVLVINTGNTIVDVVISRKYKEAGDVLFFFDLSDLTDIPISTADFIVVLSNLLDNAIEAAKKCESPKVYLKIKRTESDLILNVKNTVQKEVAIQGNQIPRTTKKDPEMHGYGLQNVISVVDANDGIYSFQCENGFFVANVLFNCI